MNFLDILKMFKIHLSEHISILKRPPLSMRQIQDYSLYTYYVFKLLMRLFCGQLTILPPILTGQCVQF